jgi:acetylornithine deacetylase/succinyl-diaminopimelate desuccinylase-like protein
MISFPSGGYMNKDIEYYKNFFCSQEKVYLEEYLSFLRFQTISADPSKIKELQSCAKWLQKSIRKMGFSVELWDEKGAPTIYAEDLRAGKGKPTLLLYNHYDVQPVDPIEEWRHPPFDPIRKGDEIFARGASDNKGQLFYVLAALRAIIAKKKRCPINIKWIIDGQEESSSIGLSKALKKQKAKLSSDFLLIVDVGWRRASTPAITLGTRGLCSLELIVRGANEDLHSGGHGGLVFNPLHAIAEMVAALRDKDGRILIEGFYDDVEMPTKEELRRIALSFDTTEYRKLHGVEPSGGEKKFSPIERVWLRPTCEINGIHGGYGGKGGKTVIPKEAIAKLSCRLVPNQNPARIAKLTKAYLEKIAPRGITVEVKISDGMGTPVRARFDSPLVKALQKSCKEVFKKQAEFIFEGASIPITPALAEASGADIALFGLGRDDNIHAPNEHFSWHRIESGFLTMCRLIDNLTDISVK